MVQDKWVKGRVALKTERKQNKRRFDTLKQNRWGDFPHFSCMNAHRGPSLIFQVSSR